MSRRTRSQWFETVSFRRCRPADLALRAPHRRRLGYELLEDRLVLSTFQVTNLFDNASGGTLRWAIDQANVSPGPDTITFATSGTINLNGAQLPTIIGDVDILGPAGGITIDGNNLSRVFEIGAGADAHFHQLTITHGNAGTRDSNSPPDNIGQGGGIYNAGSLLLTNSVVSGNTTHGAFGRGAGIFNFSGALTVVNSTLSNNVAGGVGGAIWIDYDATGTTRIMGTTISNNSASGGGGIWQHGRARPETNKLIIDHSTISGNIANIAGGIRNAFGTLTVTNSTISGNTATGFSGETSGAAGGGIWGYKVTVVHSTITGNTAFEGGGIFLGDDIANPSLSVYNSLVVNNVGLDIAVGPLTILTLVQTATDEFPLGPLQNNGGPTSTHSLPPGSIAIDNASASFPTRTDQRGALRPAALSDVGAFEFGATSFVGFGLVVTTLVDEDNGTSDPGVGTGTSLREAIKAANALSGRQTISFAVGGTITLGGTQLPTITDDLDIRGPAAGIVISGNNLSRVFQIDAGVDASLSRLTVTQGNAGSGNGGAVLSAGALALSEVVVSSSTAARGGGVFTAGNLTIERSTFQGCTATFSNGGAILIDHAGATLTIRDSIVSGNGAVNNGGGLYARGVVSTVTGSTFADNTSGSLGGGLLINGGTLSLTNSTLSGNSAGDVGGGMVVRFVSSGFHVRNSTITDNSAPSDGGIAFGAAPLNLNNSIVANNAGGDLTLSGDLPVYSGANNLLGDVDLLPLGNYGGPTPTHALPAGSPAINAANPALAPQRDQRGVPRVSPDIGAYEHLDAIIVTTTADDDNGLATGGISLREAIGLANLSPGADVIVFDETTLPGTITLTRGQLPTIMAAGGPVTILGSSRSIGITINANNRSRIFEIESGATAAIRKLALTGGNADDNGGAIRNLGTLALSHSYLTANFAAVGGAIANQGTLTVDNTTFAANTAFVFGGAISSGGDATIRNSTFSGNGAIAGGGAIFSGGLMTVVNSTFSGNGAATGGAINHTLGGSLTLNNSIVANSISGGDVAGAFSGGNNLFGDVTLGSLAANGGVGPTHALPAGSPARNAANPALATKDDQRGLTRDATPDIGAFEADVNTIVVTTLIDEYDGGPGTALGTGTSLREAMSAANLLPDATTITFDVSGTITLSGAQLPRIRGGGPLTILGPAAGITIDGNHQSRIFHIQTDFTVTVTVTLSRLNLTGGNGQVGNGVFAAGVDPPFSGNGGAIFVHNFLSAVTIADSTISGNTASFGAGIFNNGLGGLLTVINTTISANSGAGIFTHNGHMRIYSSTITGNSVGVFSGSEDRSIENSIVANNPGGDLNGNLVGNIHSSNSLFGTVPLGPLANNGGPTLTHALPAGSPAIDGGNPEAVVGVDGVPIYDQRGAGFARIAGTRIDIGAYEVQPTADFDSDGDVDGADFLAWQRGLGTTLGASLDQGDANYDGDVDAGDLAVWKSQFGNPVAFLAAGASSLEAAAVVAAPQIPARQASLSRGEGRTDRAGLTPQVVDAAMACQHWLQNEAINQRPTRARLLRAR